MYMCTCAGGREREREVNTIILYHPKSMINIMYACVQTHTHKMQASYVINNSQYYTVLLPNNRKLLQHLYSFQLICECKCVSTAKLEATLCVISSC